MISFSALLIFVVCIIFVCNAVSESFKYPVNLTFFDTKTGDSFLFTVNPHEQEGDVLTRCREICEYLIANNKITASVHAACIMKVYNYYANSHPDLIKVFLLPVHQFDSEFVFLVRNASDEAEWQREIAINVHMHRKYIHHSQPNYLTLAWDIIEPVAQKLLQDSVFAYIKQDMMYMTESMQLPPFIPKEIIFPDPSCGVFPSGNSIELDSFAHHSIPDHSISDVDSMLKNTQYRSGFLQYEAIIASYELASIFKQAHPWPHIAVDGIIDPFLAKQASRELQFFAEKRSAVEADWEVFFNHKEYKFARRNFRKYGPATRKIISELKAEPFLLFLQRVTGIAGLIPDPYDHGAAMHIIEPGGFLQIHLDFAYHYRLHLHRRVNVLLYLNDEDWDEDWKGDLELWAPLQNILSQNPDFNTVANETVMRSARDPSLLVGRSRIISPLFNRMAILELSNVSYHGHPVPLLAPKGKFRKSIAMYYYTSDIFPPPVGSAEHYKHTTDFIEKLPFGFELS